MQGRNRDDAVGNGRVVVRKGYGWRSASVAHKQKEWAITMGATKRDGISRIERADRARRLREQGLPVDAIARFLGISRSYASSLLCDPDGSKDRVRKEKYRGVCIDCGGKTTYHTRHSPAVGHRCAECAKKQTRTNRKWTRERMIADIQRWNEIYGKPPTATQWLLEVRGDGTFGSRPWPHVACVQKEFGSWKKGLKAAGFDIGSSYPRTDEWKGKVTKWPEELILEKMREWADEHGSPPRTTDWSGRGRHGDLPSYTTVAKKFGSWKAALKAAGLRVSPARGRPVMTAALVEFEPQLLYSPNGKHSEIPIPSFADRGRGKSLLDVVNDLQKGR